MAGRAPPRCAARELLTQAFGWPAIFLINVPIGARVILAGRRVVHSRREDIASPLPRGWCDARHARTGGRRVRNRSQREPRLGVARRAGPRGLAVVLPGAFALLEGRFATAPLLPLSVLRMSRLGAANLVIALLYAGVFAMWFFLTLYMQKVLGYSALQAGLAFLPMTLGVASASTLAPRLVARSGVRPALAAGM